MRLDFYLITQHTVQAVDKCIVKPAFLTDHSSVELTLAFEHRIKGPGYWKLNTSLLSDRTNVDAINKVIQIELDQCHSTAKLQWEMITLSSRGSSLQFAKRKKKAKSNELAALQKKLQFNQDKIADIPAILRESHHNHILRLQHDINKILAERARGAIIRSRANFELLSDKPTIYFMNLEKMNYVAKTIFRLRDSKGDIIDDPDHILKLQRDIYQDLYSTN